MQMPKFTKFATDGRPSYRFELGGKTYEAYRYASGAGAWNVDAIEDDKRRSVITGEGSRAAAVTAAANAEREARLDQLADDVAQMNTDADELLDDMRQLGNEADELQTEVAEWGAKVDALTEQPESAEPAVFFVEVDRHVQARPRVYEDRYAIHQRGLADPIDRFAVPYRGDRNDRETLALRGWTVVGELDYVAGINVFRGRVERTPVEYGNAGHWVNACIVDRDADALPDAGIVAFGRCGTPLVETVPHTPGHALCVGCTGDPVEMPILHDRIGWLKDGGRPVKVLRALDLGGRIILNTVTTDDKPREWNDVAPKEIILAETHPAKREEITAGTLVSAVVISNRPIVQQRRVDREPWGDDRSTILSEGRGVVSVYTASLRIVERPEPAAVPVRREGLRDLCINPLCTKDHGHRKRDGDECGMAQPLNAPAASPKCRHGFALRPGVASTVVCEPGKSYGVFGDEGPIEVLDCAVQAANDAAFHSAEDDGDTTYEVAIICPDHDEQRADHCEDCLAKPADD